MLHILGLPDNKRVMTRVTLMQRIDTKFSQSVNNLKEELSKIDYVCTTADLWTGAKRGFLGITW